MEPHVQAATDELRDFLFSHVYTKSTAKAEVGKAKGILAALYKRTLTGEGMKVSTSLMATGIWSN